MSFFSLLAPSAQIYSIIALSKGEISLICASQVSNSQPVLGCTGIV